MNTKQTAKTTLSGLLIWVVPFIIGFFFYDQNGNLNSNVFLFKSVMILALTAVTVLAIHWSFKPIKSGYIKHGVMIGVIWLLVLVLLDTMILIPMAGMDVSQYTVEIGLRYLIVPLLTVASGLLLHKHQ